ncbi:MAG: alpha/beta hydrolase [Desulfurococcales archaeon]|nr:alpha/beta hydrolase [Desulfurococcales archaeon]
MELSTMLYGVNGIECSVSYKLYNEREHPLVFLHGFSFTRNTWIEAGIIEKILENRIDVLIPDMPYGKNTDCSKHSRNVELNVSALEYITRRLIGDRKPLLVGASLGGRIALYYSIGRQVAGLFLASPAVKEDEPLWRNIRMIKAPAVIIRGQKDFIPRKIHEKLAKKLKAPLIVYEGAGHAMYLDNPERFIDDLLRFYEEVSPRDING